MKIPERDVYRLVHVLSLIHRYTLNRHQHRYHIELKLEHAEYIQVTDTVCELWIFAGPPID